MRITDYPILYEIKEEYVRLRRDGQTRNEATQSLLRNYSTELTIGEADDGLLVWIGLADAQYYRKELSKEIAERALDALDRLLLENPCITSGDIVRRRTHYAKAPMPEKKVGRASTEFRCGWDRGDVFAYKLSGPKAYELGLSNKYMIYQKVDEIKAYDKKIVPIVTLRFCDALPSLITLDWLQAQPLLRLACGRFGTSNRKFEYRAELIISSRRKLNSAGLTFLGNYPVCEFPYDEHVFTNGNDMMIIPLAGLEILSCAFWKVDQYYKNHK